MYLLGIPETVLYRRMSGEVSTIPGLDGSSSLVISVSRELLIALEAPIPFSTVLSLRRGPSDLLAMVSYLRHKWFPGSLLLLLPSGWSGCFVDHQDKERNSFARGER